MSAENRPPPFISKYNRSSQELQSIYQLLNRVNDGENALEQLARQGPLGREGLQQPRNPALCVLLCGCAIGGRGRGLKLSKAAHGLSLVLGQHGDGVRILEDGRVERVDVVFVVVVHVDDVASDAIDGAGLALCARDEEGPEVGLGFGLVLADEDEGELLVRVNGYPFLGALDAVEGRLAGVLGRGILPTAVDGEVIVSFS